MGRATILLAISMVVTVACLAQGQSSAIKADPNQGPTAVIESNFHTIDRPTPKEQQRRLRQSAHALLSDQVLAHALRQPDVIKLEWYKQQATDKLDARVSLKKIARVYLTAETNLINVTIDLPSRREGAVIANAIANSFIKMRKDTHQALREEMFGQFKRRSEAAVKELTNSKAMREEGAKKAHDQHRLRATVTRLATLEVDLDAERARLSSEAKLLPADDERLHEVGRMVKVVAATHERVVKRLAIAEKELETLNRAHAKVAQLDREIQKAVKEIERREDALVSLEMLQDGSGGGDYSVISPAHP